MNAIEGRDQIESAAAVDVAGGLGEEVAGGEDSGGCAEGLEGLAPGEVRGFGG